MNASRSLCQGLNTKRGFDVKVADAISKITGYEFITAPNKVRFQHSTLSIIMLTPQS